MNTQSMDAALYLSMIDAGALNLRAHAKEINDLNVFPIPDGDTGDNMLMTISGALSADIADDLGSAATQVGKLMLLSARGNSGVILSQFFDGIATGLEGVRTADTKIFSTALVKGVSQAYSSVMTPTEGTILTVARVAAEYVASNNYNSFEDLLDAFIARASETLEHTPELLPVLKKAGVVDSGGAGLIRIFEGMRACLDGGLASCADQGSVDSGRQAIDISKFDEDSILEHGYCTEVLLRPQNAKVDINALDISTFTDYLGSIGNSVVAFKNGSIVRIHVHTFTPDKVLSFCRIYGEFLTVKIENMSLQHNSLEHTHAEVADSDAEQKKFGTVVVAPGSGIEEMFKELGADVVVRGGQSMNPSASELKDAYERASADTVFVFPNNSNVIMTAKQAASLCPDIDIRVVETKNIGQGHAALAMLSPETDDPDKIYADLCRAIENVTTAAISTCSRDTSADGLSLYKGEYIGFIGDKILSADNDVCDTARGLIDKIDLSECEIFIIICGKGTDPKETEAIKEYVGASHPFCEIYTVDGRQEIYKYIFIAE